ncbi:DUF3526 domain-containing protein [Chitinophaga solisilvae]|uniref:DUF3526 domain-containing protein n=1 Tax=Chitinophaga solisilvae TaxID=1233460 RepID=UPI00136E4C8A|nr:DUF3526 domain-containing protein [Chitinophaga solisilvae]
MRYSIQIIASELRALFRTAVLPVLTAVCLAAGSCALFYGHHVTQQRVAGIDSMQRQYTERYTAMYTSLRADTATEQGKQNYQAAIEPAVVEYRLYNNAVQLPGAMSVLAIGMSDVARHYYPVKINAGYTPAEEKLSNPQQLMTGNFDLAFVCIYLLPLMLIALTYNLFSQEQEQGTLKLLIIQQGSFRRILLMRLCIRWVLLLLLVTFLILAGIIFLPAGIPVNAGEVWAWIAVTAAYTLFWAGVCWVVTTWGKSSGVNLIALLSCWLLLLVVMPAVIHFRISDTGVTDDTATNASRQRDIAWDTWELPQRQLLDSFYQVYPQYRNHLAYDTSEGSMRRSMAYYQLAEQRMDRILAPQQQRRQQQLAGVTAAYAWSPAVYAQALYSRIAHTDITDDYYFRQQVTAFREQWKHYFYGFYFNNRQFTAAAYATIPKYQPAGDPDAGRMIGKGILYLTAAGIVLLAAGCVIAGRRNIQL